MHIFKLWHPHKESEGGMFIQSFCLQFVCLKFHIKSEIELGQPAAASFYYNYFTATWPVRDATALTSSFRVVSRPVLLCVSVCACAALIVVFVLLFLHLLTYIHFSVFSFSTCLTTFYALNTPKTINEKLMWRDAFWMRWTLVRRGGASSKRTASLAERATAQRSTLVVDVMRQPPPPLDISRGMWIKNAKKGFCLQHCAVRLANTLASCNPIWVRARARSLFLLLNCHRAHLPIRSHATLSVSTHLFAILLCL